jgi:hypothetical protein
VAKFTISGKTIELPASKTPQAASSDRSAWRGGEFITVRFDRDFNQAIRVHTDGRAFPDRVASDEKGRWIAIGDVIMTSIEIVDSRALPGAFTRVANVFVPSGCVANIGVAARLFAGIGGGLQAEYVSGPTFRFKTIENNFWHSRAGLA